MRSQQTCLHSVVMYPAAVGQKTGCLEDDLALECVETAVQEELGQADVAVMASPPKEPSELLLNGRSSILKSGEMQQLAPHLPPRMTTGHPWSLLYCTARNGFSLKTLYRSMTSLSCPVLLVIRDTNGQVFKWTGSNTFFMKGDADLLVIGGGRSCTMAQSSITIVADCQQQAYLLADLETCCYCGCSVMC
ncbi:TLD domain-containing protein 2 isoform X7 [Alligator sinensis]|uniref:TLD domain-containing protein 2 isoform X7 n=1 Tax=Alligator sinensis TaxID=38654 RepID=A0A3Q0HMS2_ALLSI|nr:TLD domain-containing protein 2 isoform X7 [Alligator sinensis]